MWKLTLPDNSELLLSKAEMSCITRWMTGDSGVHNCPFDLLSWGCRGVWKPLCWICERIFPTLTREVYIYANKMEREMQRAMGIWMWKTDVLIDITPFYPQMMCPCSYYGKYHVVRVVENVMKSRVWQDPYKRGEEEG